MFWILVLSIFSSLVLSLPSTANQYKKEKILHLNTVCTNGGCVQGGVYLQLIAADEEKIISYVERFYLQGYWDATAVTYCRERSGSEVVYSLSPNAPPHRRIWVKYDGEATVIGFTTAAGLVVERFYEIADVLKINEEISRSFRSDEDGFLPIGFSVEELLWISSAIIARSCAL